VTPGKKESGRTEGSTTPNRKTTSVLGRNSASKHSFTPKRKSSVALGIEEETTPNKRPRMDGPTLRSSGKKSGNRSATASPITSKRLATDVSSPKVCQACFASLFILYFLSESELFFYFIYNSAASIWFMS
jgi:hypothetical protein